MSTIVNHVQSVIKKCLIYIDAELDAEDIENFLPNFIEAMTKAPKKRMKILLKGVGKDEYADRFRKLIEIFWLEIWKLLKSWKVLLRR